MFETLVRYQFVQFALPLFGLAFLHRFTFIVAAADPYLSTLILSGPIVIVIGVWRAVGGIQQGSQQLL